MPCSVVLAYFQSNGCVGKLSLKSVYLNVVPCKPFMWDHCILQADIARSHMHMTCKISFNRATKMKTEIQNKMKMATEKTPNMHFVPTYYLH